MSMVICIKAAECPHAIGCQHGKEHERLENCSADRCTFASGDGVVECTEGKKDAGK